MGDTLTHLPSKPDVIALFRRVSDALHSGGIFVITYRDLTLELRGADRFIPVRSDENAIMTCFLEYENSESVLVHDLVYTRQGSDWTLGKSSYSKLRLGADWVLQELSTAGLAVEYQDSVGRLLRVVAKKPKCLPSQLAEDVGLSANSQTRAKRTIFDVWCSDPY
jgi:regulation of enolase protein 1 (concanavalin A-like superfamily)